MGSEAFKGCTSLKAASFPLLVGNNAQQSIFMDCLALEEIYMPLFQTPNINAFYNCQKLRSAELPAASWVGTSAFANCYSLSWASFARASHLMPSAFVNCSHLASLYLLSTTMCVLSGAASTFFAGTPMVDSSYLGYYGSIYVLPSLVATYKANASWKTFSDRITSYIEEGGE